MNIRNATYRDAPAIKSLLEVLGYKTTVSLLINQLEMLFSRDDHQVFVYEHHKDVLGFIAIHFLPQLAFDRELVMITCLSVDESVKDHRIGKALEDYVTQEALKRNCNRIQAHCQDWKAAEYQFYAQQGYQEHNRIYEKKLVYRM